MWNVMILRGMGVLTRLRNLNHARKIQLQIEKVHRRPGYRAAIDGRDGSMPRVRNSFKKKETTEPENWTLSASLASLTPTVL